MKVILRTDMENLGQLGEVVAVKPGYARNYLIPKKIAMPATDNNMKIFEQQRKKLQERIDAIRFEAQDLQTKLSRVQLVIPVRVGENEKLYGSVTSAHIADALAEKGLEVDKKKILLESPIRSLGEHNVQVKLHPEVHAEVKVSVVRHDSEMVQGE